MAITGCRSSAQEPAKASLLYDPKVRSIFFQVVLSSCWSSASGGSSTTRSTTCARSNISTGFGFLRGRAGFDISDSADRSTRRTRPIGRALRRRLLNTLIVAVAGIIIATIIGFLVGIGRLSQQLADPQDLRRSMSRSSATSRRCWSSSSGISACWRCCRRRATASCCRSAPSSTARLLFSALRVGRRLLADRSRAWSSASR